VEKGQVLLTLEAMKMEHQVAASADGVVGEVRVSANQQVEAGQVLLVIEPAEKSETDGR
jgi:propionyl-CoA carboxylase alpha chain